MAATTSGSWLATTSSTFEFSAAAGRPSPFACFSCAPSSRASLKWRICASLRFSSSIASGGGCTTEGFASSTIESLHVVAPPSSTSASSCPHISSQAGERLAAAVAIADSGSSAAFSHAPDSSTLPKPFVGNAALKRQTAAPITWLPGRDTVANPTDVDVSDMCAALLASPDASDFSVWVSSAALDRVTLALTSCTLVSSSLGFGSTAASRRLGPTGSVALAALCMLSSSSAAFSSAACTSASTFGATPLVIGALSASCAPFPLPDPAGYATTIAGAVSPLRLLGLNTCLTTEGVMRGRP